MSIIHDRQYEKEFSIRHRMPRPIARSYEAVAFATNSEESEQKIIWCASVAIRFLSAVRQANHLALNPGVPLNPPSFTDLRLDVGGGAFVPELDAAAAAPLAHLAGIYSDRPLGIDNLALRRALARITFLCRFRLVAVERDGFRLLVGPRMEREIWNSDHHLILEKLPPGSVFLYEPDARSFLCLSPLLEWVRPPESPFGRLFLLRRLDGNTGYYIEEGIPGSRGMAREVGALPVTGALDAPDDVCRKLALPPGRFSDGLELDGLYRTLGVIWKGGTSDIYVARRMPDKKLVMLKTYEHEAAGFDDNYYRFLDEERTCACIDHPQVIRPARQTIPGFGVMHEQEMVQRGSLHDLIEYNGVLSVSMAADISVQLLDILESVHGCGVAHNDIKPDNILFDGKGKIRLIDFGIAFNFADTRDQLRPGVPAGSEGYMAPELKAGSFPSAQSDLFSAGVVFAQMLAGDIVNSLSALNAVRSIPRKLFAFFERCLDSDPGKRFASAREAKDALAGVSVKPELCITLDVEGTLVTNYADRRPRPGLHDFLSFCMSRFDRIFVYTMLDEEKTREVFDDLAAKKAIPSLFTQLYEYVGWVRGRDGSIKDLRRCGVPLEHNAIVDDMRVMIPEDQIHRWIRVPDYSYAAGHDGGLLIAKAEILKKFNLR